MSLVRALFFTAAQHNFTTILQHTEGVSVSNGVADALFWFQFHRSRELAPGADETPTPIPAPEMWT